MTDHPGRIGGKSALVTGGASGIGLATARRFVAEGARVTITDVSEDGGNAAANSIGEGCRFLPQDITDEQRWDEVVADCADAHGSLDILVNCAGIFRRGPIEHESLQGWRETISVNLDGSFLACRAAVRAMKGSGGSIVLMSSVAGNIGDTDYAAYDASKGGVRLLSKSVAVYCAGQGYRIRCNSVHPGSIDTPMTRNETAAHGQAPGGQVGGQGRPEDVASLILFLASDDASYISGSELVIDDADSAGAAFSYRRFEE